MIAKDEMRTYHAIRVVPFLKRESAPKRFRRRRPAKRSESCFRLARKGRTLIPRRPAPKHARGCGRLEPGGLTTSRSRVDVMGGR
jgi:hypothetical protein